ncbi:hypothetical protein PUN4_280203 [Paraburkholderia unamae]|nr:hypothetical protein PUN4_280203 [Paraburkholderia unamae]
MHRCAWVCVGVRQFRAAADPARSRPVFYNAASMPGKIKSIFIFRTAIHYMRLSKVKHSEEIIRILIAYWIET